MDVYDQRPKGGDKLERARSLGEYGWQALRIIIANHRSAGMCPESVARSMHITRRHLYRCVQPAGNVATLIAVARSRTAVQHMIRDPEQPLEFVAHRSGFGNRDTLRTHLRRIYGMGPRQISPTTAPIGLEVERYALSQAERLELERVIG